MLHLRRARGPRSRTNPSYASQPRGGGNPVALRGRVRKLVFRAERGGCLGFERGQRVVVDLLQERVAQVDQVNEVEPGDNWRVVVITAVLAGGNDTKLDVDRLASSPSSARIVHIPGAGVHRVVSVVARSAGGRGLQDNAPNGAWISASRSRAGTIAYHFLQLRRATRFRGNIGYEVGQNAIWDVVENPIVTSVDAGWRWVADACRVLAARR